MSTPNVIFTNFLYHISSSYPSKRIEELQTALDKYGGKRHDGNDLEGVNLIITNSLRFEGWERVKGKEGVLVVTDLWVDRSIVLGRAQPPQFYSANPSQVFSGVTATAAGLPPADLEVLSAGIQSLGGQWRPGLTKDVTHLFAISRDSDKYATAFQHKEQTGIKILLPHWFDDVVRLGIGTLSTEVYEWPNPPFLQSSDQKPSALEGKERKSQLEKSEVKRTMYATAALFAPSNCPTQSARSPSPPVDAESLVERNPHLGGIGHHDVWKGKRFLLSRTLQLYGTRREAVQIGIERSGGEVLRFEGDDEVEEDRVEVSGKKKMSRHEKLRRRREADLVEQVDILITRWRHGRSYAEALKRRKTIGTLGWMFHVQCTGVVSRPVDQLLHYPIPNCPIPNFAHHVITLTNYTGEAREYLKKLITAMGASFTPSMSSQNTILIAAFIDGTKAAKAESWSIPVVNHTWLEDCFVQWRNLTHATSKYIHFPPKVNFSQVLGERGLAGNGTALASASFAAPTTIGSTNWEDEIEGLVFSEDELEDSQPADDQEEVKGSVASDEEELRAPIGTEDSMKEVAGLVTSPLKKPAPVSPRTSPKKSTLHQHIEDAMDVTSGVEEDEPPKKAQRKAQPASKRKEDGPRGAPSRTSPTKLKSRRNATPPTSESSDADENPRDKRKVVRRVTVELEKLEPSPSRRVVATPAKRAPDPVAETKAAKGDARTRVKRKSLEDKSVKKTTRTERARSGSEDEDEDEEEVTPKTPQTRRNKEVLQLPEASTKALRGRTKDVLPAETVDLGQSAVKRSRRPKALSPDPPQDVEDQLATPVASRGRPHRRTRSQSQAKTPGKDSKKPIGGHSDSESPERRTSKPVKGAIDDEVDEEPVMKPESSRHREQATDVLTPSKTYAGRKKKRLSRPTAASSSSSSEGEASFLPPTRSPAKPTPRTLEKTKVDDAPSRPKPGPKSKMLQRTGASSVDPRLVAVLSPSKGLEPVSVGGSKSLFPDREKATNSARGKKVYRVPSDDEEEEDEVSSLVSPKKSTTAAKKKAQHEAMDVDIPSRRLSIGESDAGSTVLPRRNAAAKATQRLHETIMPDLVHFEVQMRKSRKSGGGVVDFVVEGDSGRNSAKKRRESTVESVGDEEDEDAVEPKKKKRRVSGDIETTIKPKAKTKEDVPSTGVSLMTTQVNLAEDVVRGLTKLGVKMVMRPSECTHLLAASVVRTEKFLCALAKAPFILSEKWATQSVAAKKLLPEKDFLLVDNAGESKYGVKLVKSIQRAKENQGGLFSGHTFYVTPKVPTDKKLLKNVVAAHGGELSSTTPTLRILNVKPSHRHIISCKEDISIWRGLSSSGFKVYTQELLLTGTLRQEVEWDNPDFQVRS